MALDIQGTAISFRKWAICVTVTNISSFSSTLNLQRRAWFKLQIPPCLSKILCQHCL